MFVHRSEYVSATIVGESFLPRVNTTTPLMAALGMGGGRAWVQADRSEREPLALEAAELAIELGIDINFADTDGRTALDAATRLRYESVVNFLVERGALRGPEDESN